MRKMILPSLLLLALIAASVAAAAPPGLISGGVTSQGGSPKTYAYVELPLSNDLAVGLDYSRDRFSLSGWQGLDHGFYVEGSWSLPIVGRPDAAEFGYWGRYGDSSQLSLMAWVGAKAVKGDPAILLSLNAEADLPLSSRVSLFAGGSTSFFGQESHTHTWLGLGYKF